MTSTLLKNSFILSSLTPRLLYTSSIGPRLSCSQINAGEHERGKSFLEKIIANCESESGASRCALLKLPRRGLMRLCYIPHHVNNENDWSMLIQLTQTDFFYGFCLKHMTLRGGAKSPKRHGSFLIRIFVVDIFSPW